MLNRSKLAAVGLLAAVFLAGGLAGWRGREAAERDGRGNPRRGPDAMVQYLTRELDLSPAQRDSVRAIFARHRAPRPIRCGRGFGRGSIPSRRACVPRSTPSSRPSSGPVTSN